MYSIYVGVSSSLPTENSKEPWPQGRFTPFFLLLPIGRIHVEWRASLSTHSVSQFFNFPYKDQGKGWYFFQCARLGETRSTNVSRAMSFPGFSNFLPWLIGRRNDLTRTTTSHSWSALLSMCSLLVCHCLSLKPNWKWLHYGIGRRVCVQWVVILPVSNLFIYASLGSRRHIQHVEQSLWGPCGLCHRECFEVTLRPKRSQAKPRQGRWDFISNIRIDFHPLFTPFPSSLYGITSWNLICSTRLLSLSQSTGFFLF